VVLIVGDMCYCANVGDSRAILSSDAGEITVPLSRDHKPCESNEYQRIVQAGGKVYQTITSSIVK
jgi:serine/threonine protein phosphatase PrpC